MMRRLSASALCLLSVRALLRFRLLLSYSYADRRAWRNRLEDHLVSSLSYSLRVYTATTLIFLEIAISGKFSLSLFSYRHYRQP